MVVAGNSPYVIVPSGEGEGVGNGQPIPVHIKVSGPAAIIGGGVQRSFMELSFNSLCGNEKDLDAGGDDEDGCQQHWESWQLFHDGRGCGQKVRPRGQCVLSQQDWQCSLLLSTSPKQRTVSASL